jgi:trk system potassium uptake protein TrkH
MLIRPDLFVRSEIFLQCMSVRNMAKKPEKKNILVAVVIVLGIVSLFIEFGRYQSDAVRVLTNVIDYVILLLFIIEVINGFARAPRPVDYLRENVYDVLFLAVFLLLFLFSKYAGYLMRAQKLASIGKYVIIVRNVFMIVKIGGRLRSINALIKRISTHPAQAVLFSFLAVIIVGTLLLMMTFSTADRTRLGFVDALFTATSAVCVTGLIVVDTATRFSIIGKVVILFLIQIGGLGIMVLSYFMMFLFRKRLSLERTLIASFMLEEEDVSTLYGALRSILRTTLIIEFVGFLLLLIPFSGILGLGLDSVSIALFHSISAFCNAGFSLFSDNLFAFSADLAVNMVIASLIVLGGLGFSVLINLYQVVGDRLYRLFGGREKRRKGLSLNSMAVVSVSGILVLSGMLIMYACEHGNTLLVMNMGTQYLAAFFQSVTLRTAGFNTIDIGALHRYTYLFMILFMFIGGASGSTAGGVKVNTIAVIGGYIHGIIKNRDEITLFDHAVESDVINRAFFIIFLYVALIFLGTFVLSMTEEFESVHLLFEVVSAIGTVGLSAGITPGLSVTGRLLITVLMFIGRVGPLTIFVALSQRKKRYPVIHPTGHIAIG